MNFLAGEDSGDLPISLELLRRGEIVFSPGDGRFAGSLLMIHHREKVLRRLGREGRDRTAIFDAIIAPPRSGSTRTGLIFHETNADLVITEPAARFDDGDARWEKLWEFFDHRLVELEEKAAAEGRDLVEHPLRIVSKFISHHIGPLHEADAILDLHSKVVFLVRAPHEALESNIAMILDLAAILSKSNPHVKECPADAADMKKARNYSSLTERAWLLHYGIFSTPSLQREIWTHQGQQIERENGRGAADRIASSHGRRTWEEFFKEYLGTPNSSMLDEGFPAVLREPFFYRQSAWNALEEIYERARRNPEKYRVYDFGLMRLFPEEMAAKLIQYFGLEHRVPAEGEEVPFITGYGTRFTDMPELEDRLFGAAKKKSEILPSFKRPIGLERFPHFLRQDFLDNQIRVYLRLLSDPSLEKPEGISVSALIGKTSLKGEPLRKVDPVYSYMLAHMLDHMPDQSLTETTSLAETTPRLKKAVLANLRRGEEEEFGEYFDAVDKICRKNELSLDFQSSKRHFS